MASVVHKFMQIMAGDEGRRALLGADEIDGEESQDPGERRPWENFPDGDRNRPANGSVDRAAHVLPLEVRSLAQACRRGLGRRA